MPPSQKREMKKVSEKTTEGARRKKRETESDCCYFSDLWGLSASRSVYGELRREKMAEEAEELLRCKIWPVNCVGPLPGVKRASFPRVFFFFFNKLCQTLEIMK